MKLEAKARLTASASMEKAIAYWESKGFVNKFPFVGLDESGGFLFKKGDCSAELKAELKKKGYVLKEKWFVKSGEVDVSVEYSKRGATAGCTIVGLMNSY